MLEKIIIGFLFAGVGYFFLFIFYLAFLIVVDKLNINIDEDDFGDY